MFLISTLIEDQHPECGVYFVISLLTNFLKKEMMSQNTILNKAPSTRALFGEISPYLFQVFISVTADG